MVRRSIGVRIVRIAGVGGAFGDVVALEHRTVVRALHPQARTFGHIMDVVPAEG